MLPKINQMMFLQKLPDSDPDHAAILRSRVADEDDGAIYLEIPLDEKTRRLYRCQVGDSFRMYYFTQEGVKHLFATEVTGLRKDAVPLIAVRKPAPEEVSRDQRRSYLRVEAQLELAVNIGDKVRFVAITDDVGGGGLSFRCERHYPIEPEVELSCWLLLPYRNGTVAHAKFIGQVVRVLVTETDRHLVMMRFIDIQDADRQKVIRYCFERQLDNRKA